MLPFDADLTVKGLDKVLFDAGVSSVFRRPVMSSSVLNRENAVPISSCNSGERFNGDFLSFKPSFSSARLMAW